VDGPRPIEWAAVRLWTCNAQGQWLISNAQPNGTSNRSRFVTGDYGMGHTVTLERVSKGRDG
jgi:protocatechuate 3,4-dioxygenase beta subunit